MNSKALFQRLVSPSGWEEARSLNIGHPPAGLFIHGPIAELEVGVFLVDVRIKTQSLDDYSVLSPDSDSQQLAAAMQHLKSFDFITDCGREHALSTVEIAKLREFFTAMCSSRLLENVRICLEGMTPQNTGSLWSCIPNFKSPKLRKLRLQSMGLHLTELAPWIDELLVSSSHPMLWLKMERFGLLSGKWADALDVLREKAVLIIELERPWNFEDGMTESSWPTWHEVFKRPALSGFCKADDYVNGWIDQNPLRTIESDGE
ncbi:uncharacterized protein LY89DRAFT_724676 [Mollisia scopiformis]|uniref:Uncharacterized protein n=1 Tax=Mollisia scopiformis TaxID=149040 RepID=A0A132B9U8_MOLSC|nr:uncharacterized protein LY89DRAFT_724676 [Mollisia scopiformis]KUJ09175.1 hypothetical protein LY89DRAFT_724676 [Mollisia scopiformis]